MYIWWIFLLVTYKTVADSANNGGIFQVEVGTKTIGRIKYQDGEVVLAQNQQKPSDFFFTPFPYVQPEETQCYENVLSDRVELGLQVELYTPQLIRVVKDYLYKYKSSLCGNLTSSFMCDVSLLPMHSIRLVQKGSRSNGNYHKYILDESWQSATLLLQSMEFVIYTSNMTVCEQLRKAITEKCRLPNFEVHYSLHDQQTVQRQLELNTEHITSTNMYNQIRAQFPSAETVVLTENDFKKLLSESIDRIIMMLRMQEEFERLQDPMFIEKRLEKQLSIQQVRLDMTNHKLWENLYWNPEFTRPDRLAKVLNSIIYKESGDSERFIYDRRAVKDAIKMDFTQYGTLQTDVTEHEIADADHSREHIDGANLHPYGDDDRVHLTQHDKQRLAQFDKLFESHNRLNTPSNSHNDNGDGELDVFMLFTIGISSSSASQGQSDTDSLNVKQTDQYNLNVTQNKTQQSISTPLNNNMNNLNANKIGKIADKQYITSRNGVEKFLRKLFNNVYLEGDIIKPRPINARLVKIGKLSTKRKLFSTTVFVRMRPHVHILPLRCKPNYNNGKSKLWLTDRVDQIEDILLNLSSSAAITELASKITNVQEQMSAVRSYTEEVVSRWQQTLDTSFNKINQQADNLYTNLTNLVKKEANATSNKINVQDDNLYRNLTDMMKQKINITTNDINVQVDNVYTNLTDVVKQETNTTSNKINVRIDNLDMNLTNKMNLKINNLGKNLTDTIKQDINTTSNELNVRINNLDMSLTNTIRQVISPTGLSNYSSSFTHYSTKYQRPNKTENSYAYETIRIQVVLSGSYQIACNSTIDTYGYIYTDHFDRSAPNQNLLASDDDSNGNSQFRLNVDLQTGMKYILVVTTSGTSVIGSFTIYTTAGIHFTRMT